MTRPIRITILLIGLLAGQFILFGPSLVGRTVLAPLDILGMSHMYLAPSQLPPGYTGPFDQILMDQVHIACPNYDFAASEIRAGRLPLWNPYIFAGAPFAAFGKFSPFSFLYYAWPSPFTLAWMQLAKSLVAGVGAYLFFRRCLSVRFWPAVIGAWCYPLTAYFMLWQGFGLTYVLCWLPWIMLATDRTIRQTHRYALLLLAIVTALCLLAGQLDISGLVLLGSGLFAIATLLDHCGKRLLSTPGLKAVIRLACGWGLGFMLAAPYVLPLVEYSRTGDRFIRRSAGAEERPPVGLPALPQLLLPNMYGATHRGSMFIAPETTGNLPESSSTGYAGLLTTLFLAPLALSSRRHLAFNITAILLTLLSFCWVLNVPGVVSIMRLPGLNTFSFNRFTFLGAFLILSMAVIGLDQLSSGQRLRSPWFLIPTAVVLLLGCWCGYRSMVLPEPLATQLASQTDLNATIWGMPTPKAIELIQHSFHHFYRLALALCGVALAGWIAVLSNLCFRSWMAMLIGAVAMLDLLLYGYGINPQADPALYYPRIPALVELADKFPSARILGIQCFPPNLNQTHALRDIRGYDAVDPKRLMDLLDLARNKGDNCPSYARSQWFVPNYAFDPTGRIVLPPVLNMLNVRYLIFQEQPPPQIQRIIYNAGYVVLENKSALPRVFVPRTVQVIPDDLARLRQLGRSDFDPADIAYVEQPVDLPAPCHGNASITDETPTRLTVQLDMQTPGLLVLADLWDAGWHASLNNKPLPILRTNHALRGVLVPPGQGTLIFRYEPFTFRLGLLLAGIAALACATWGIVLTTGQTPSADR